MLLELSIKNFAIIDDITISFKDGLTVLTGETGAGKSIIIDAVQLLTGHRGSTDYVRYGYDKAEIVGLFLVTERQSSINEFCMKYNIPYEDDTIILERTISKSGSSVCRINGKIVTLTILREIGQKLVNIHSQHDTMHLLKREQHLSLLDRYNDKDISEALASYQALYEELTLLRQKYNDLSKDEQQTAHRLDLLQFQLNEIEQANLQIDEDDKLEVERKQLQNFEQIYRSLQEANFALTSDGKGLESIYTVQHALQQAKENDDFIAQYAEQATTIYYQLEDIQAEISAYMDELFFDENRLNEIEARLNELSRLKKKYGASVEEMLQYKEKISNEIDALINRDSHLENLQKEITAIEQKALQKALQLHEIRIRTAKKLESDIKNELNDLYLENATFKVDINKDETNLNANGIDDICFMLSTNKGEPPKQLDKIASGGELSRIMLALKKIFAEHDQISTVIFDEIDTGVSGRVAQAIAEKMYQISLSTQTLCITHLPQVAAMADDYLLIRKLEDHERTTTEIIELDEQAKVEELGKIITGSKLTATAIEHAQEMLELTATFKKLVNGKFN